MFSQGGSAGRGRASAHRCARSPRSGARTRVRGHTPAGSRQPARTVREGPSRGGARWLTPRRHPDRRQTARPPIRGWGAAVAAGGYGLGRGPECTFWLVSSMLRARVGCTSSSSSSSPPSSFCPRAGTEADERVRPPCPASDARACQGLSDQAVEGTIRDLMELVPFHWRRVPGRARASSSARTAPQRGHPRGLAGMVWSEWSAPARDQLRLVVVWIQ